MCPSKTTRVAAIVALYRPSDVQVDHALALAALVDCLVVVDDTGGITSAPPTLPDNCDWITQPRNLGLAASLNRGVDAARRRGCDLVVTFDQDTICPEEYIRTLAEFAETCAADVGAVGPDSLSGWPTQERHPWRDGECSPIFVQSGVLFRMSSFDLVGPFREDFIIDAVETEFLLRMHRHGLHAMICPGLDLPHAIGAPRTKHVLGRSLELTGHSPDRRYYMWRNHLTWIREYGREHPGFARRTLLWYLRTSLTAILFEPPRGAHLRAWLEGIRDFARGRYGHRPDARRRR